MSPSTIVRRGRPATLVALVACLVILLLAGLSLAQASTANARAAKQAAASKAYVRAEIKKLAPTLHVKSAVNATELGGHPASSYEHSVMWAYVSKTGVIGNQTGGITITPVTTGSYLMTFPSSVDHHAITATPVYGNAFNDAKTSPLSDAPCGGTLTGLANAASNGALYCTSTTNTDRSIFLYTDANAIGFYVMVAP
jgi:hypothetical protein